MGLQKEQYMEVMYMGFLIKPEVVQATYHCIIETKGLNINEVEAVDMSAYKEEQYDKLAAIIRENLDMSAIYKAIYKIRNLNK